MSKMQARREIASLAVVVGGDVLPRLGALGLALGVGRQPFCLPVATSHLELSTYHLLLATCCLCRQLRIAPAAAAPLLLMEEGEARPEAEVGRRAEPEPEAGAGPAAAGAGNGERDGWLRKRYRGIRRFAREFDQHAHTSHALFLGSETTPARQLTIPLLTPWPVPPERRN